MWGLTVWVCGRSGKSAALGMWTHSQGSLRHLLLVWGVEFFALCILSGPQAHSRRRQDSGAISPWLTVYPVDA